MSTSTIEFAVVVNDAMSAYVERSIRAFRLMRNSLGLATPIGHVVPPRGTFNRAVLELHVWLRRAVRSIGGR